MKMRTLIALSLVAVGVAANAQVDIMDQVSSGVNASGNAYASQFFTDFAGFEIASIDDFNVTGSPVKLNYVDAGVLLFNTPFSTFGQFNADKWDVQIYSSVAAAAANFTGNVASATGTMSVLTTPLGGSNVGALIRLNVSAANIQLNPGTYYVGVTPYADFTTRGQVGIFASNGGTPGGANGWQTNPGGAFGFPGNQQQIAPGTDLMYRINATVVPEPATMVALGAGLLALTQDRKSVV